MTDPKQTPVAPVAQNAAVQSTERKDAVQQMANEGNRTLPGTDPAGKQVSPQLDNPTSAEVPSTLNTHPAGLDANPRQLDNGVRATLPADANIGPDSPHDNPMPGTNQVNPSAESLVALGMPLDPTARQQPLSAGG